MSEPERELSELKSKLLLQELKKREMLLAKAKGRPVGWKGWIMPTLCFLLILSGIRDVKGMGSGTAGILTGILLLLADNMARTHLRMDAMLELLSSLEREINSKKG